MSKILTFLIVIALVGILARMAFQKFNPKQSPQSKSDFHRQLDIILWAFPVLITLSAAYYLIEAIFRHP